MCQALLLGLPLACLEFALLLPLAVMPFALLLQITLLRLSRSAQARWFRLRFSSQSRWLFSRACCQRCSPRRRNRAPAKPRTAPTTPGISTEMIELLEVPAEIISSAPSGRPPRCDETGHRRCSSKARSAAADREAAGAPALPAPEALATPSPRPLRVRSPLRKDARQRRTEVPGPPPSYGVRGVKRVSRVDVVSRSVTCGPPAPRAARVGRLRARRHPGRRRPAVPSCASAR